MRAHVGFVMAIALIAGATAALAAERWCEVEQLEIGERLEDPAALEKAGWSRNGDSTWWARPIDGDHWASVHLLPEGEKGYVVATVSQLHSGRKFKEFLYRWSIAFGDTEIRMYDDEGAESGVGWPAGDCHEAAMRFVRRRNLDLGHAGGPAELRGWAEIGVTLDRD